MPRSIITLTTDFGASSPYVAEMKGAILSINPEVTLVDVTHSIPPQDIRQAALVLADSTRWFPSGTIHVCVVDPGVGTDRRIVCAEIDGHYHVAPDNGLLSYLLRSKQATQIAALANRTYWLPAISSTFHGRDIMAPVAAHLSLGIDVASLGPPAGELAPLDWPAAVCEGNRTTGAVIAMDSFGNLITNIEHVELLGGLGLATVLCGDLTIRGIISAYGQQSPGSTVALFGSSGRLEIAVVNGNASRQLPIAIGDGVIVISGGPPH